MKLLTVLLFCISMPLMAETYYVDCTGDVAPINYFDKDGNIKPFIEKEKIIIDKQFKKSIILL